MDRQRQTGNICIDLQLQFYPRTTETCELQQNNNNNNIIIIIIITRYWLPWLYDAAVASPGFCAKGASTAASILRHRRSRLGEECGHGIPFPYRQEVKGSVVSSPSGARSLAPVENERLSLPISHVFKAIEDKEPDDCYRFCAAPK